MAGSLVRYAIKRKGVAALAYRNPYAKRARVAYAIGSAAYAHVRRNRGKYRRAARTIGRAFRRSRARRARGAGRVEGAKKKSTTFRNWANGVNSSATGSGSPNPNVFGTPALSKTLVRKKLYMSELVFCEPPDNNANLRAAPRMIFHVSGFKLCGFMRNISAQPLNVHCALLQPKQTDWNSLDLKTDFFSNNTGNTRYTDYIDRGSSPAWDKIQDCRNINNRKWNIMFHKRFILNEPRQNSGPAGTFQDERKFGANYKAFDDWIQLNKNFEFGAEVGTGLTKPLFLAVWFETVFPVATPDASQSLEVNIHTNSYVRDVK